MTILQDIYQLKPSNLITLYELDLSPCIGRYGATSTDVYRWCDGVNELGNDIVFGGVTYTRYPIQATGFDKQGNGSIPRPKLIAGNYGGIIGNLARDYNDIVGAKVKRIRTFARYLDTINFKAKNYFKKSNDFSNSVWTKTNTSAAIGTNILPFPVGSKVSISGVIPVEYNISKATVVSSTPTSVSIESTASLPLLQEGIISGGGYSSAVKATSGTGSIATITFDPIVATSPVINEPVYSITESATNGVHTISQIQSFTAGKTYCISIYARLGLRSKFKIELPTSIFSDNQKRYVTFDLLTGGIVGKSSTSLYTIDKVDNYPGWYRCSISETVSVTQASAAVVFQLLNNQESSYIGSTDQPAILCLAPQLTEGSSYPQEYYPEAGVTINTNPFADSTQYLDKEVWTIDRKSNENSAFVEWELTAPYDLIGVKIPRRQCIQNVCPWKYRGSECGYTGTSYFNIKDEPVANQSLDICGKRVSSCKLRFPGGQALPYGGFPAIGI